MQAEALEDFESSRTKYKYPSYFSDEHLINQCAAQADKIRARNRRTGAASRLYDRDAILYDILLFARVVNVKHAFYRLSSYQYGVGCIGSSKRQTRLHAFVFLTSL